MFYKCILFKVDENGVRHQAATALKFSSPSLEEILRRLSFHARQGWQFAEVDAFNGAVWRFVGVIYLGGEVSNG